jgi:hypothetical protein
MPREEQVTVGDVVLSSLRTKFALSSASRDAIRLQTDGMRVASAVYSRAAPSIFRRARLRLPDR